MSESTTGLGRSPGYGRRDWPEGHVSEWPAEVRRAYLQDQVSRARVVREDHRAKAFEREREELAELDCPCGCGREREEPKPEPVPLCPCGCDRELPIVTKASHGKAVGERRDFASSACALRTLPRSESGWTGPAFRELRDCDQCGDEYVATHPRQRYCRDLCRSRACEARRPPRVRESVAA